VCVGVLVCVSQCLCLSLSAYVFISVCFSSVFMSVSLYVSLSVCLCLYILCVLSFTVCVSLSVFVSLYVCVSTVSLFVEEMIFVLSGRGSTSVWNAGEKKNSFEWQAGSLFAIPLNAHYQHFNGSGTEPARYLAVTTAPIMMNLIRNDDFIFNNDAVFPERYDNEEHYFSGKISKEKFDLWDIPGEINFSNFFADVYSVDMRESNRGVNSRGFSFEMANGVLGAHVVELPGGTFSKLHRHGPGAHVIWLKGEGYTLMWPDGEEKNKTKEYWGPGTMIVPPNWWWHQHCVISKGEAEHLALKLSSKRNKVDRSTFYTMRSTKKGGNQMNYEDIPADVMAEVTQMFLDECAKRGTPVQMGKVLNI